MSIHSTLEYTDTPAAVRAANIQAAPAAQAASKADMSAGTTDGSATDLETALFGADGFTFGDLLDAVNPLQHIPVVATLYRKLTGDEIGAGARVVGGGLFGGIAGVVGSLVNLAIEQGTGKDVGGHVMALFDGEGDAPATGFAALEAKPGATSGHDAPAPAPADAAHAARQYAAARPEPFYAHTLDIGP